MRLFMQREGDSLDRPLNMYIDPGTGPVAVDTTDVILEPNQTPEEDGSVMCIIYARVLVKSPAKLK